MTIHTVLFLCALGGYLLGSIPFGLVLTRMAGYGDIRKIGSGNIGATNVLRTGNKTLALLTVILDAFKAGFAAWLAYRFVPAADYVFFGLFTKLNVVASLLAGTVGVLGHNFPVWLGFKGGKGVASAFGFIVVTNWHVGLLGTGCLADNGLSVPLFFAGGPYRGGFGSGLLLFHGRTGLRSLLQLHRRAGRHPPSRQYPALVQRRRKQNNL